MLILVMAFLGMLVPVLAFASNFSGSGGGSVSSGGTTNITGLLSGDGSTVSGIANVATGQVFTSGTPPAWSASPTVSNITVSGTAGSEQAPALTAGNWTVGSGWESPIVGPGLIKNADGTGTQTPSAATTIVANTIYKLTFTVINLSVGSFSYTLGGNAGTAAIGANGTFTQFVLTNTTGKLIITPTNTSRFTISAISIVPITNGSLVADGASIFNGTLNATGAVGIGATATPLTNAGLYINNPNGPGLLIKPGPGGGSHPDAVFGQNADNFVKTMVSNVGALYSIAFWVVSGEFLATYDAQGNVNISSSGQSNLTSMFESRSDVNGSAIVASTPSGTASLNYASLDGGVNLNAPAGTATRNINWAVDKDGKLRWGASAETSTGTRVGSVTVTSAGSSCTSAPTITPSGGGGSGALFQAFVSGGTLQRVEIVEPGFGYTSAPSLAVSGGGGCTGTVSAHLMDTALSRIGAGQLAINDNFIPQVVYSATPSSDVICAKANDSIAGITCNNTVTDGTTATAFTTSYTFPSGTLSAGRTIRVTPSFAYYSSANAPVLTMNYNTLGADLYSNSGAGESSRTATGTVNQWEILFRTTTTAVSSIIGLPIPGTLTIPRNNTVQPVTVSDIGSNNAVLTIKPQYPATGLASGTYTSGITAVCTAGQTCNLASFNNSCSSTTATVACTGVNTIAGGTALVVTNTGAACTSAPTSATASAGTATSCSGTATVSTSLGGAQGNALRLLGMKVELY